MQAWIVALVVAGIMLSSSVINLLDMRHILYKNQTLETRAVVTEARSIVNYYYDQYLQGKLPEAAAKQTALAVIASLSYDKDNYVYVYSYDYTLLVNRVRPDLIGLNRENAVGPDGVHYVKTGVDLAKSGGGYYNYVFNSAGITSNRIKTSYTLGFDPWQLMLGSGTYYDSLDEILFWHYLLIVGTFFLGLFLGLRTFQVFTSSVVDTSFSWIKDLHDKVR